MTLRLPRTLLGSRAAAMSLTSVLFMAGCPGDDSATGAATSPASGSSSSSSTGDDASAGTTTGATDDPTSTTGDDIPDDPTGGVIPVPPACEDPNAAICDDPLTKCKLDADHDGYTLTCDNAPKQRNPGQEDIDGDGFGDVADLCPLTASEANTGDADRDGVGNECDTCRHVMGVYNKQLDTVPFYMRVRNIPQQDDADRDGIGDACDNCVTVPNCWKYGEGPGLEPHVVGLFTDVEAPGCQDDADLDLVGDACAGLMAPGAAGPVGFADGDDFDQDGLANLVDGCPRQPVARTACDADTDCPDGATCSAAKLCNHADHDGDKVGDICDTCPWASNPEQVTEAGADVDDADFDFIGAACEQTSICGEFANPRPFAFYDVSAGGFCCVTTYNGQPLIDPDGDPLDVAELGPLPPGVLELPPGCDEALARSADGKAHRMKACHVDDIVDLWQYLCLMPAWDQEFDGVPDRCDLCPFAYDPTNAPYVDANMMEWPNYGKYCHGDYDPDLLDPADMCLP